MNKFWLVYYTQETINDQHSAGKEDMNKRSSINPLHFICFKPIQEKSIKTDLAN